MFIDYMIPVKKAVPTIGASVIVRLENTDTVHAKYDGVAYIGSEVDQPVISWIPTGPKCSCEKSRWLVNYQKGRCGKCDTVWL